MVDIALGYGSKWHRLRYLGWHGSEFDSSIRVVVPAADGIEWLDFPFDPKRKPSGSGNIDAHLNDSRERQEEAHPSPDESERRGVTYVQAHPGPNRSHRSE